jgi:hypothetical protein
MTAVASGNPSNPGCMPVPTPTRRRALLRCAFVAITALLCAGLLCAAALVPAPPAVLPLLVVVCIGSPMAAACELPGAIDALRRGSGGVRPLDARALEALRRQLDGLPETQHPLGL